jgi:hypothetical protein
LPIIGRFSAETRNLIFYAFRAGIGLINSWISRLIIRQSRS